MNFVSSPTSYEKCAAISRCVSVILRQWLSLRRVCMHHEVLSNVVLGYPSCLLSHMFILPSQKSTAIAEHFSVLLHSLLHKWKTLYTLQCEGGVSFQFIIPKPNTYKTGWIHSKILVWTGVTILSTRAKFYHVSVTRMRKKKK